MGVAGESPSSDESSLDDALRDAASTSFLGLPAAFGPATLGACERYEIVRELGRGGFGVVYEAIDRGQRDAPVVALKYLAHAHADRLYRFKREFRSLADVHHRNLVQLYELVATDPDVFFTMERIEGSSPLDSARDSDTVRSLLRQLALGLTALHRAGKLHRDVKPSNILVEPGGRVVLLDFGLAIDRGEADRTRAGTPLYMSPEQCAEQPLGTASDWYAVGAVLFEALTGRRPFEGSVEEIVAAKQVRAAPRVRSLVPDVAADLDELCAELLALDPEARPTGDEILRRLSVSSPGVTETELFVGRAREKAELARAFEASIAGQRTVVLASGPSGIGKTALLRCFLDGARRERPDAMILAGRCFELESVPYKALDAIVDEVARHLRQLAPVERAKILPADMDALATLFPVFRELGRSTSQPDAGSLRGRGLRALRELFLRLRERGPVVVCIDDVQWGDVDSAALFAELIREPSPPAICWVMSFRDADAKTSPLLSRLPLAGLSFHDLRLEPLAHGEAEALATALCVSDPRAIALESQGSPFFIRELARAPAGDHALGTLVRARVSQLRGAARSVLDVIAIAGQPLELDLVAACVELGGELRGALGNLREEYLVRGHALECYHDRIREAVVAHLEPGQRAAIHLALAAALEAHGSRDAARIGLHLAEGGSARALGFLTSAAEQAAAALAFDEAAQLYRRALDLPTPRPLALELAYAEILSVTGHAEEAARLWLSLVDRVDERERIELRRRATEELLLAGHVEDGYASMRALLAELDLPVPRSRATSLAQIVRNRVDQALFGFSLRRGTASSRELQRIDALGGLAWTVLQLEPLTGYALQTQHLRLALRSGDRLRAATALWLEAPVSAMKGSRGTAHTERIIDAARAMTVGVTIPDAVGRASEGTVALFEGRWAESLAHLRAAEQAPTTSVAGHGSLRGSIYAMRAINLYWMGRSGDVLDELGAQLRDLEARAHLSGWLWLKLLEAWALSCSGKMDAAWATSSVVEARLPAGAFQLHRSYLAFGRVKFLLIEGKVEEAWRRLQEIRRRTRFAMLGQSQRVSGLWVHASTALARGAARRSARAAMLDEARRLVRKMERERVPWVSAIAQTVRASIAAVAGERSSALQLLADAEPQLEAHGFEALLAMARLQRGAAGAWMQQQRVTPEVQRVLLPGWE